MKSTNERWVRQSNQLLGAGLVITFLAAGASKLLAVPMVVAQFEAFGLPRWALVAVGATELGVAALLFVRKTRFFGALAVCATMLGAAAVHLISGVALPMLFANALLFAGATRLMSTGAARMRAPAPPIVG